jgi:hypothetical protein
MTHRALATAALAFTLSGASLLAQTPATPRPVAPVAPVAPIAPLSDSEKYDEGLGGARTTRNQLQRLLRQYPPALGEVLQRDPSLLGRSDYVAPYPALVAFLQQHPEIARNPEFFFGGFWSDQRTPQDRAMGMFEDLQIALAIGIGLTGVASVLVWLIKTLTDHRKWLRQSRVQVEVHTKLIDRMAANADLLAYMQTPAGSRFLESAPITLDGEPRAANTPVSRIVWSLQAGVVLVALGVGLTVVQRSVLPEVATGFNVMGILAIALGVGFAASALVAYVVSTRLGLLPAKRA